MAENAELRERIQKLKALVGITDDALDLVDILTLIHGVNMEL